MTGLGILEYHLGYGPSIVIVVALLLIMGFIAGYAVGSKDWEDLFDTYSDDEDMPRESSSRDAP